MSHWEMQMCSCFADYNCHLFHRRNFLRFYIYVCEELTHWKRLWCWEGLRAGGEGDARGWDGWRASLTRWTWVWVNSRSWWWTGRPGVLPFMGSQRVGHDWATELNWTDRYILYVLFHLPPLAFLFAKEFMCFYFLI